MRFSLVSLQIGAKHANVPECVCGWADLKRNLGEKGVRLQHVTASTLHRNEKRSCLSPVALRAAHLKYMN